MDKRKVINKSTANNFHLRRVLSNNKKASGKLHQIDSPLAKYDSSGNLNCIICKIEIKSATLWKVHVNSNNHKLKVEAAKNLVSNKPAPKKEVLVLTKPVKSKSNETPSQHISEVCSSKVSNDRNQIQQITESTQQNHDRTLKKPSELLPEQFFDDPLSDAKARNVEPKDNQDVEWARFQKEIKEESSLSNAIIAEEQDDFNAKRQLTEIDEQIKKLNKVIEINERKKCLQKIAREQRSKDSDSSEDSSLSQDELDDDLAEWRVKRLF